MPTFRYKAVSAGGEILEGHADAPDRESLIDGLKRQGHVPIRAEAAPARAARRASPLRSAAAPKAQDALMLTRELGTLLSARIPVDRALSMVAEFASAPALAAMARRILERLKANAALSDAMTPYQDILPPYYLAMVRAGEAGNTLDQVLERLADTMERAAAVRAEIRGALTYPVLVLVMAGLSILALMAFVIPEFRPLFEDARAELPTVTVAVLAVSDFVRDRWWAIPLPPLAIVLLLRRDRATPKGRRRWDGIALATPLVGDLVARIEAARFCRTLGTLLQNGESAVEAVDLAAGTIENVVMRDAVAAARTGLVRGDGLAGPLGASRAFPPLAVQLVGIGEESGQLPAMLVRAADILEGETRRSLQRLLSLLVPAVTIALGALVALVVGSLISAILSAYDLPL